MANKLNVNLVLCQKYDDETKTIGKIFNEITTNAKHEATFSVITFMNGIDDGTNDDENFVLHYFLVEMERRRGLYLGATEFYKNSNEEQKAKDYLSNSGNTFSELTFENVPFIGEGEYKIEAYKVNGVLDDSEDYEELRKKANDFRKNGEFVSFASFIVKYPRK